jgi:phage terminase small subunit
MSELNEKQKLFCKEYIIDFNATRAYAKIYNREHDETSRVEGHNHLTNPNIQEYIKKLIKPKCDKLDITVDNVLRDILEIKERCMQKVPVREYNRDTREWIETGEWEFDASNALKATEQLGKYLKLFTDKHELTGKDGEPIENDITIRFVDAEHDK